MNVLAATEHTWTGSNEPPRGRPARGGCPETTFRSGALAEAAGVNIATLRYYERKGLLPEPPRSAGGYREYPADALRRLEFIGRAKSLGFSLTEIKDLLELRIEAVAKCADVRARADAKLESIHGKIAELKRFERGLERLMADCSQRGNESECPILDYLDGKT